MARLVKEKTDLPLAERHVSMSNKLARAAQGLSLSEKRILALGLVKTDSVSGKDATLAQHQGGWKVRLRADEYAESYEVSLNTAYEQLQEGGDHLYRREIRFDTKSPRGNTIVNKTRWVTKASYCKGEGWIELSFTPDVAPHLLGLRKAFCTYKLKQAAALRSIYAWRLYECLQSWKDTGMWRVDIADFMHAMDVPASMRKDFGQMDRRVLKPAVTELKLRGDLDIDIERVKAGRKITGLVFKFRPAEQMKLDL